MKIDMEYIRNLMIELLDIPSPSGDTATAMKRIKREFDSLDIPVIRTNKGALIGTLKGSDDENHRMVSAHIDTLGAIVREIKPDGRLRILQIGGFSWNSVEGENVIISTMDGKKYSGTILPEKASIHGFSDEVRQTLRTDDFMEVRIDELTSSREETLALDIEVGDFVSFEPRPVITKSGFVKARHLDDKACVAVLFGICKYFKDNNLIPRHTTHLYISNYEEIGHGISVVPEKTDEFVALDIGIVGKGTNSSETAVTICAKDSRTPYNFELRKRLVELARKNEIEHRVDVHFRYGSDATAGVRQGFDFNFACIGMGVDASHHYERTHLRGIEATARLLGSYLTE